MVELVGGVLCVLVAVGGGGLVGLMGVVGGRERRRIDAALLESGRYQPAVTVVGSPREGFAEVEARRSFGVGSGV